MNPPGAFCTIDIPLDQIVVMPGNPRQDFEPKALQQLADGIRDVGQTQPGCVRAIENGEGYELFIGERRFRACALAGVKTYRASVYNCTRAEAVEMRVIENEHREDFNPIEQAVAFQQMLDEGGYTQQKLADRFGISQGEVSNTVRLLKLPAAWQKEIISGDMTPTDARVAIPLVGVKNVLDHALKFYREQRKKNRNSNIDYVLERTLDEVSRPLHAPHWYDRKTYKSMYVDIKPTAEQLQELDVVEIKWGKSELRAFNITAWAKLAKASDQKHKESVEKRNSKSKSGGVQMTAADKERQYEGRLWRYLIDWKHCQIRDQIETQPLPLIMRLMIHFACEAGPNRDDRLEEILEDREQAKKKNAWQAYEYWGPLKGLAPGEIEGVVRKCVTAWCATSPWASHADIDPEMVEALAEELQVNVLTDWRVDEDFLSMHTIDQLQALCSEWKLHMGTIKSKKSDLIELILREDRTAAVKTPKCLINAKKA